MNPSYAFVLAIQIASWFAAQETPPFEIRLVVGATDEDRRAQVDLAVEKKKLTAWLEQGENKKLVSANTAAIDTYNRLGKDGPHTAVRWVPREIRPAADGKSWDPAFSAHPDSPAVGAFTQEQWNGGPGANGAPGTLVELFPVNVLAPMFGGPDVDPASVSLSAEEESGLSVLSFEFKRDRLPQFARWTKQNLGASAAFVFGNRVLMVTKLMVEHDSGRFVLRGRSRQEFEALRDALVGAAAAPANKPPVPTQAPASADPADIRAIQGAQAMLEAEKRLRQMIKDGKIAGIDQILTFEEISSWPYEDGIKGMPKHLEKLSGKTVMMTGFMLPIDEVENIKEFLLVQSLWSCCYGQPPDINGIVRVVMKNKRIDYSFEPLKVIGTFKIIASYEDGYCVDIYQLHADSVEPIK
jgi:hypothetical protein